MKWKRLALIFFMSLLLAACGATSPTDDQASEKTDAQNIKQLVHEYSVGEFPEGIQASITADELIVTDGDGEKKVYELPKDEFFVSIAPYIEQTHV